MFCIDCFTNRTSVFDTRQAVTTGVSAYVVTCAAPDSAKLLVKSWFTFDKS